MPRWFLNGFGGTVADEPLASVDPEGSLSRTFSPDRVMGAVVYANYVSDGPGITRQHAGNKVILGEPSGTETDHSRALAERFQAGGIDVEISDQIQGDIWYKLWAR